MQCVAVVTAAVNLRHLWYFKVLYWELFQQAHSARTILWSPIRRYGHTWGSSTGIRSYICVSWVGSYSHANSWSWSPNDVLSLQQQNKYLKGLMKNPSSPQASMVKNYLISELSCHEIGLSFKNSESMDTIFSYMDKAIVRKIRGGMSALNRIHYDKDAGQLYCDEYDWFSTDVRDDRIVGSPDLDLLTFLKGEEE